MTTRISFPALAVGVALAASGCSPGEPAGEPARQPAGDEASAAAPEAGAATNGAPWYRRTRALDLTGDGRADTVHLEAVGARTDSLRVALVLVVGGREVHREEWGSSYELALADPAARAPDRVGATVRAALDSVLASVVAERLDLPSVRLMAEDSAALAGIEPRPTHRVSFAYGYETTVRLAWDARRERFVRLWSCC